MTIMRYEYKRLKKMSNLNEEVEALNKEGASGWKFAFRTSPKSPIVLVREVKGRAAPDSSD